MRMGAQGGTSARLNSLKVPVAGKTGTAQTRSNRQEKFSQHAWFIGYGPYEGDPEKAVIVVVFVEYGIAGARQPGSGRGKNILMHVRPGDTLSRQRSPQNRIRRERRSEGAHDIQQGLAREDRLRACRMRGAGRPDRHPDDIQRGVRPRGQDKQRAL